MSPLDDPSLDGWESVEESLSQLGEAGAALEQFLYEQLDELGQLVAQLAEAACHADAAQAGAQAPAGGGHGSMQERLDAAEAQIARWADAEQHASQGPATRPRGGDQLSQMVQLTELLAATRRELSELKSQHDNQLARHDNQLAEQHLVWMREMQQLREALSESQHHRRHADDTPAADHRQANSQQHPNQKQSQQHHEQQQHRRRHKRTRQ